MRKPQRDTGVTIPIPHCTGLRAEGYNGVSCVGDSSNQALFFYMRPAPRNTFALFFLFFLFFTSYFSYSPVSVLHTSLVHGSLFPFCHPPHSETQPNTLEFSS